MPIECIRNVHSVHKYGSGYNPPKFVTDAAKEALDRVDCNQYSPTKVLFFDISIHYEH